MVASLREQLQKLSLYRSFTLDAEMAQDRVIDDNLNNQIFHFQL